MGILTAALRELVAAGLTGEALVSAMGRLEAEVVPTESAGARRTRKWRANNTSQASQSVTSVTERHSDNSPSPLVPPGSPSSSPTPPITTPPTPLNPPFPLFLGDRDATRPAIDELFEQFWKIYPKRDGANPKQPAKKRFVSALKSGAVAEDIQQGARRYRAECDNKKITGTPMVAQAMTWLNQQRWGDYAPPVAARARGDPTPEQLALRRRMIEEGGKLLNGQEVRNTGS